MSENLQGAIDEFARREVTLAFVLDQLPGAVLVTDANDRVTYYNQGLVDLAGYAVPIGSHRSEWGRMKIYNFCGDEVDLIADGPSRRALKEGGQVSGLNYVAESIDGKRCIVSASASAIFDDDDNFAGLVTHAIDVTKEARCQIEKAELVQNALDFVARTK